jgi:hypothetical protein
VSQRSPAQQSAAQSVGDAWPAPTVGRGHRTVRCAPDSVRCAIVPKAATVDCALFGRQSRTRQLQWLSGGAHHTTEGKISLSRLTVEDNLERLIFCSCLGAIKGTPRRMEEEHKHSQSILRLQDSNLTHSILCDSDLSSIWVVNSVRLCLELKSWLVCVVVLRIWVLCVLLFPTLLLCVLCDQYCKSERLQLVEIPRKREKTIRKKSRGIQVDHWITWKELSATLVHWDATTWK